MQCLVSLFFPLSLCVSGPAGLTLLKITAFDLQSHTRLKEKSDKEQGLLTDEQEKESQSLDTERERERRGRDKKEAERR